MQFNIKRNWYNTLELEVLESGVYIQICRDLEYDGFQGVGFELDTKEAKQLLLFLQENLK